MDKTWWNKMTSPSHFISRVTDAVSNLQSIIMQIPKAVPWYNTMYDIIYSRITSENGDMKLVELEDSGDEPGKQLLNEFCKSEKIAQYRPAIGYAKYLAESTDIVLNDRIIWIKGANSEQIEKWSAFISDYNKYLPKNVRGCVLIIEAFDDFKIKTRKGIIKFDYISEIVDYDYYLFNLMVASELKERDWLKTYLSEVVLHLFSGDVELSAKCMQKGKELLNAPYNVIMDIVDKSYRSNGDSFEVNLTEAQVDKCMWEAQIKTIYPLIERHRTPIITKYAKELEAVILNHTIKNSSNDVITDLKDLEIGAISYIVYKKFMNVSQDDERKIYLLREARNKLSHITCMPQNMIDDVFQIDLEW